jgi:hypothetical protein
MKIVAFALLFPTLALSAGLDRATPAPTAVITPTEAGAIKTYSLRELTARAASIPGEIVKIKFSWAGSIRPAREGTDTLVNLHGQSGDGYGFATARVPKEGANWLAKLPTSSSANKTVFAFARVEKGGGTSGFESAQIVILGKELKTEMKSASFSW